MEGVLAAGIAELILYGVIASPTGFQYGEISCQRDVLISKQKQSRMHQLIVRDNMAREDSTTFPLLQFVTKKGNQKDVSQVESESVIIHKES